MSMFLSISVKSCLSVRRILWRRFRPLCWIDAKLYSCLVSFSRVRRFLSLTMSRVGYTHDEKLHIARRYLLPKQLKANGLTNAEVEITEPALLRIATGYTREAGVRTLERAIGAVIRWKAVEWAEWAEDNDVSNGISSPSDTKATSQALVKADVKQGEYKRLVEENELEKILGIARWDGDERDREERRGVVYGLVVMGQGEGGILPVETIIVPGQGGLKLTGSLGDVSFISVTSRMLVLNLHHFRSSKRAENWR